MPYGEIRVDTITFTNGGVDTSISVSGLAASTTGNLTVTGTISGATVRAATVSGVTVTGTTVQGASGTFTSITGGTATITSGLFASGTAANPSIAIIGDANTGLYSPSADQVAISTSGTGRLFVDASGKVGIGASNPGYALDVVSSDTTAGVGCAFRLRANATASAAALQFTDNGATTQYGYIACDSSFNLKFATGTTERARIDSSGRLGLGTSSPGARFQINTQDGFRFDVGSGAYSYMQFGSATTGESTGEIGFSRSDGKIYIKDGIIGGTFNTRLTIDGSGRVGIGTTSPTGILTVERAAASAGWIMRAQSTGVANESGFFVDASNNFECVIRSGGADLSYIKNLGTGSSTGNLVFYPNGVERARLDSFGRLLVGASTSINGPYAYAREVQFNAPAGLQLSRFSVDAFSSRLTFVKSRNATTGSHTVVNSGDALGELEFGGSDGTAFIEAARIAVQVDGTPGTNDMPGRIVFSTTADGASSPTERLRITSDGKVGLGTSSPYSRFTVLPASTPTTVAGADQITIGEASTNSGYRLQIGYFNAGANGYMGSIQTYDNGTADGELILNGLGGRVGIGTTAPGAGLHLTSAGQATSALNTAGDLNFILSDSGNAVNNGGSLVFAANNGSWRFASIKGLVQSGANNTLGDIAFSTRTANTDAALSEKLRISYDGTTTFTSAASTAPAVFKISSTEVGRWDSGGRLLIGASSNFSSGLFQVRGSASIGAVANDAFAEGLFFTKTRGTTPTTYTSVADGDELGSCIFRGADGSGYVTAASITARVDGTPGTNDMPGRLVFGTTADGASTPTERMRIDSTGFISLGGDTNTGFSNPSADNLALTTGGSERARINSSGRLLVGTSSSLNVAGGERTVQIEGTTSSSLSMIQHSTSVGAAPLIVLGRSKGTANGSTTTVVNGDYLGYIQFVGANGSNFSNVGAEITAVVDGTVSGGGANDLPTRLVFSTTADGASSPTERVRITSGGPLKAKGNGANYLDTSALYHELNSDHTGAAIATVRASNATYDSLGLWLPFARAATNAYNFLVATSNHPTSGDSEFILTGDGNGKCDGAWTGGGADYAEYFEWSDANPNAEDRRGISVVLDGEKIRPAVAEEDPIGVISGNPSVVGDAAWNKWSGKYLRDEFGTYILEDYEVTDDDGNTVVQQRRKLNPAYDPDAEYISREQRPEWDCVGLMGKLRLRKGQPTGSRWIKMRDISANVEEWLVR